MLTLLLLAIGLHAQHVNPSAMGFDPDKAVHHFLITNDGGVIQVDARDRADTRTLDSVRLHLRHIAMAFKSGDFGAPLVTHGEVPPGVPAMQRLKSVLSYSFEETSTGGGVRITSTAKIAIDAVHEFLRYQIREHKTGDPL